MSTNLAALRSQIERALAGRVTAPFHIRDRTVENVSTGIAEVDALVGGLPRGALTEVFGPSCSGRTSLLYSALGARTLQGEACALIDGCDAFDPHSAEAGGINLKQLLWVRCRTVEQSFRATDYLLQAGGFGFVALDLSDIRRELVHRVPLDTWFRFRRAVEGTPTILLVLGQESHAKTCASLVLRLNAERFRWKTTFSTPSGEFYRHPFSLLGGSEVRAEAIRLRAHLHSRVPLGIRAYFDDERDFRARNEQSVVFKTDENLGF